MFGINSQAQSVNGAFSEPRTVEPQSPEIRLKKAFHAFKSDPTENNVNRIAKAVAAADGCVYIENKVQDFVQSLEGRQRYEGFVENFNQLWDRESNE